MALEPIFHLGYVVADLDESMETLGAAFDLRWAPSRAVTRLVHTESGVDEVVFRVAYSLREGPYLEIVEGQPGTLWSPDYLGIHHVGFWADDVRAESDRLAELGFAHAAHTDSDAIPGAWRTSFNRNPAGGYVEFVSRSENHGPFVARMAQARSEAGE